MDSYGFHMALILLLPLIGGLLVYLMGSRKAIPYSLIGMIPGLALSVLIFFRDGFLTWTARWEWLPGMELGWRVDQIAAILIFLVYLISFLVHLFSAHYMRDDPAPHRYFAKLGFFTSSMVGLLMADHLLLVFIFWELVGFSSFLLIGFWFADKNKSKSAREAFMINRIADAGLLTGVILMMVHFRNPFLSEIMHVSGGPMVTFTGLCLVIGAFGKSAQFPFFGWLPKAMAGPTPVSALIHAATMVAAGVYLLVRIEPFLSPEVLATTATIGSLTAFMAAIAALVQDDIKGVLAYSTISQLGYMVMGIGVGAYQASLFHLWTHAFFKAGLFLCAGAVIHYMHHMHPNATDHQDMRSMGGLRKVLPLTFVIYIICGLALSGLPFFSGFLSKEGILSGAWIWASENASGGFSMYYLISDMAFITALLTPIYILRQILLVFAGNPRSEISRIPQMEPFLTVKLPLITLAFGSLWIVNAINPFNAQGWLLKKYLFATDIIEGVASHHYLETYTLILSIALSVGGLAIAYLFFRPGSRRVVNYATAGQPNGWYGKLAFNAWWVKDAYDKLAWGFDRLAALGRKCDELVIERVVNGLGVVTVFGSKLLAIIDREIIDGLVNFAAWLSKQIGWLVTRFQSEKVQNQLGWMIVLLVALIIWLNT